MASLKIRVVNALTLGGAIGLLFMCQSTTVHASSLVFQGQNVGLFPNANPNSVSVLMNSVSKKKATASTKAEGSTGLNPATMIQNALVSQISTAIYKQIFNVDGPSTGFYDLGGGNTISYQQNTVDQTVTITIVSSTSGTTTVVVPLGI